MLLALSDGAVVLVRNGVASTTYSFGIVRARSHGVWRNICTYPYYGSNYYGHYESDVVCHQLGYVGASSFSRAGLVR